MLCAIKASTLLPSFDTPNFNKFRMKHKPLHTLALLAALCSASAAHASLFADNEARRAILDLRQRYQTLSEENAAMRETLEDAQNKLESLNNEVTRLRGREEYLTRELTNLRKQTAALSSDIAASENASTTAKANAQSSGDSAQERAAFDAALKKFRNNDYAAARTKFNAYLQKYPNTSRRVVALYWLGNSNYALRNYRNAMANYQAVVAQDPNHDRAPEALLALAACQVELRDVAGARATLEKLINSYPNSGATRVARERLARLR